MPEWQGARRVRDLKQDVKADERHLPRALPLSRLDCPDIPRPCPYVSCRYNLYADVTASGSLIIRDCEPDEMPAEASCALDIAEDGAHTQEEIGVLLGVVRQRVIQIEEEALEKLRDQKDVWDLEHMAK